MALLAAQPLVPDRARHRTSPRRRPGADHPPEPHHASRGTSRARTAMPARTPARPAHPHLVQRRHLEERLRIHAGPVLGIGHTSGTDILSGLLAGLHLEEEVNLTRS
ncbi:hypothetical protein AB0L88_26165 [Saccharopolyspora shandongensis]|uniref:hypothetical protein n=1 Tax=Saccharopolyspora shandongensis TaxID=418495 RepID=UPI0034147684